MMSHWFLEGSKIMIWHFSYVGQSLLIPNWPWTHPNSSKRVRYDFSKINKTFTYHFSPTTYHFWSKDYNFLVRGPNHMSLSLLESRLDQLSNPTLIMIRFEVDWRKSVVKVCWLWLVFLTYHLITLKNSYLSWYLSFWLDFFLCTHLLKSSTYEKYNITKKESKDSL